MAKYYLLILIAFSALTHFIFFGRPNEVVFDEVYFGAFSSAYGAGTYFFDIHPPLGKLLISAAGYAGGFNSTTINYSAIGNGFSDSSYLWYRILPILAGFLLPLVIFRLCLRLKFSPFASFLAGLFIILENSLLVQSRFMFLDSFLILFGFSALLFYFYARSAETKKKFWLRIILTAVFAGLSFSVKWTGLSFLGLIILMETWDLVKNIKNPIIWRGYILKIGLFGLVGFSIYFATFAVHFSLLPDSGAGDGFMTPAFQKTLNGNNYAEDPEIKPIGLIGKFIELNKRMYTANETLTATHPYSSRWYTWPIMSRPIYYWVESAPSAVRPGAEAKIYFLGNPFIYWLAGLAIIFLAAGLLYRLINHLAKFGAEIKQSFPAVDYRLPTFLLASFLISWLPFIFIGRVMFLYHYLSALIFAIMALALAVDRIKKDRTKIIIGLALVILFSSSFIFFSPLSYGLPLSPDAQNIRFWFKSWR